MQTQEADLLAFVANVQYKDLPPRIVDEARMRLLDQIGVILGGIAEEPAELAIRYAEARGGAPEAFLYGSNTLVDAEFAAFANGVSGHVLELDDGNRYAMGHPGVVVVPALLAYGEATHASGKDLVAALVAGYEFFVRVGSAMNPSHYNRGFHTTGTVGTLAATAAVARLAGLDQGTLASALGLAGSQAGGLFEFLADGAMSKQLHAGAAAAAAIRSVRLAQAGFTGPTTVLQGANGFLRAYADEVDPTELNRGLGESWAIVDCYVKLHACCRHIHPVVDAIQALMQDHGLTADALASIDVGTYKFAAKLDNRNIDTDLDAKMSIPYSIAVTLLEDRCGLGQFRRELFHDPRVAQIMDRVEVHLDPELDAMVPDKRGCRVTVKTSTGTRTFEALLPRGEPEDPVGPEEIRAKYLDLSSSTLDLERARVFMDRIESVDALTDVAELNRSLSRRLTAGGQTEKAGTDTVDPVVAS
jgi:2-methylcitrate dehydratase PrpD